jgi:hypothetical protein
MIVGITNYIYNRMSFICSYGCGLKFTNKSNLYRHERNIHHSNVMSSVTCSITSSATSNVTSNATSNVTSNAISSIKSNSTSSVQPNATSNATSNATIEIATVKAPITVNITQNSQSSTQATKLTHVIAELNQLTAQIAKLTKVVAELTASNKSSSENQTNIIINHITH